MNTERGPWDYDERDDLERSYSRPERDDPDDYDRSEWIEEYDDLTDTLFDIGSTEADERIRKEAAESRRAYLAAYFAALDHLEGK